MSRTLADLYRPGVEVEIFDEDGVSFGKYWLQKPSATDMQTAFDRAAAARAATRSKYKDRNGDDYIALTLDYRDQEREELASLILQPKLAEYKAKCEAKILHADDSEWGKDNYLYGLMEAWGAGANDDYARDPDDPAALNIFNELKRFEAEVAELVDPWQKSYTNTLEHMPLPGLIEAVVEEQIKYLTDRNWVTSYRNHQVAMSLYEGDRRKRVFAGVTPPKDGRPKGAIYMDDLAQEVKNVLHAELEALEVSLAEGKDSPPQESSSTSSDDAETAEA